MGFLSRLKESVQSKVAAEPTECPRGWGQVQFQATGAARPQWHRVWRLVRVASCMGGVVLAAFTSCTRQPQPPAQPGSTSGPQFSGKLLHRWDFESGEAGEWSVYKLPGPKSLEVVSDPNHPGNKVARFTLHRDDPIVSDGKRAELHIKDVGEIGTGRVYWYGFRTCLPTGWETDHQYEVVAQWKGRRDPEEDSKSPALALRVRSNEWYITNRWDPRTITPRNRAPRETLWRGELDIGRWTSWVVRVRWSYEADGLLEIWKDGERILEKRGANTYNDRRGMYFKIGIYKPPWGKDVWLPSRVRTRVVYHDDVWIGVEI